MADPEEVVDPDEAHKPIRRHRRQGLDTRGAVALTAAVSLTVGGLAFTGAIISARDSASAAIRSTNSQIAAEQSRAARTKRGAVYAAYLDAADKYSRATDTFVNYLKDQPEGSHLSASQEPLKTFIAAQNTYQNEVNQVYVYGSDDAWRAHVKVASTLPNSNGSFTLKVVDSASFSDAYSGFLKVFCREVPALPRKGC